MIIAPAVIPSQAGIQEGRGAVVKGRQVLLDTRLRLLHLLSFPLRGNVFHKPLDSGLRRNDGGMATRLKVSRTLSVIPEQFLTTAIIE